MSFVPQRCIIDVLQVIAYHASLFICLTSRGGGGDFDGLEHLFREKLGVFWVKRPKNGSKVAILYRF